MFFGNFGNSNPRLGKSSFPQSIPQTESLTWFQSKLVLIKGYQDRNLVQFLVVSNLQDPSKRDRLSFLPNLLRLQDQLRVLQQAFLQDLIQLCQVRQVNQVRLWLLRPKKSNIFRLQTIKQKVTTTPPMFGSLKSMFGRFNFPIKFGRSKPKSPSETFPSPPKAERSIMPSGNAAQKY